jgi:two-component system CheB/CheR fusion protein
VPVDVDERIRTLEDELTASRHYLQSIIQELEAANEELQSANEEILSSNEELQSTNEELDTAKEELQSTNEELNTVNDELHGRNEELSRANSDLMNILSSVQIAILIVSSDLRIRRFTPMAERMLNLIASDVGRPIGHLKPDIDCPELEELIHEAIDTVSSVEREVQDRQGGWFSLRIRPYKNLDNRIDGAVLSLFDVDALRRQEIELRETRHYADAVVAAMRQPVAILAADLRVRAANPAFVATYTTDPNVVGQPFLHLDGGRWDVPALRDALGRLSSDGPAVARIDLEQNIRGNGRRRVMAEVRRIDGPEGRPPFILVMLEDPSAARGVRGA